MSKPTDSSSNTPDTYADLILEMIPRFENNARLHAYLVEVVKCAQDEAIEACAAVVEAEGLSQRTNPVYAKYVADKVRALLSSSDPQEKP